MNLIVATVLALIILLCLLLIPNKLIAVAIALLVVIMVILIRPDDFTSDSRYLSMNNKNDNANSMSQQCNIVSQQPTLQANLQPTLQPNQQPTLQPNQQPTLQPNQQQKNKHLPKSKKHEKHEKHKHTPDQKVSAVNEIIANPSLLPDVISGIESRVGGLGMNNNTISYIGTILDSVNWENNLKRVYE